jgi:hypothetical protein
MENLKWLDEVKRITSGDRRLDYGRPLVNFLRIAIRWSLYLGRVVTPLDVAVMMIEMKLARNQNEYKDDNFIDIMGYAACIESMDEDLLKLNFTQGVATFVDTAWWGIRDLIILLDRAEKLR